MDKKKLNKMIGSRQRVIDHFYPTEKVKKNFDKNVEKGMQELREERRKEVGYKIKEARQSKNMSQKELAEKLGTKQEAISRMENGKQNISLGMLQKTLDAIGRNYRVNIELL